MNSKTITHKVKGWKLIWSSEGQSRWKFLGSKLDNTITIANDAPLPCFENVNSKRLFSCHLTSLCSFNVTHCYLESVGAIEKVNDPWSDSISQVKQEIGQLEPGATTQIWKIPHCPWK